MENGLQSSVYLAKDNDTQKNVAIKSFHYNNNNTGSKEFSILSNLDNINIIKVINIYIYENKCILILNLCKKDFFKLITEKPNNRFTENESLNYFKQLINAVEFCHRNNIFHRDIKLENLFLGYDLQLKLGDFGFSTYNNNKFLNDFRGTQEYMAPEIFDNISFNGFYSDMWACGIILFIFFVGNFPFQKPNISDSRYKLFIKNNKLFWKLVDKNILIPNTVKILIKGLLNINPKKRYNIDNIKNNLWFNQNKK